jgi:hypothetical protein
MDLLFLSKLRNSLWLNKLLSHSIYPRFKICVSPLFASFGRGLVTLLARYPILVRECGSRAAKASCDGERRPLVAAVNNHSKVWRAAWRWGELTSPSSVGRLPFLHGNNHCEQGLQLGERAVGHRARRTRQSSASTVSLGPVAAHPACDW